MRAPFRIFMIMVVALTTCQLAAFAQERQNFYQDPFLQVTHALAACPTPEGPMMTAQEARAESHWRVERGTSCYRSGRCRLPNSYLYDKEIMPRVQKFILQDDQFQETSVWIKGQRRWVYLMGCVKTAEQAAAMEQKVRDIDDVEAVINQLQVGTPGHPPYPLAKP